VLVVLAFSQVCEAVDVCLLLFNICSEVVKQLWIHFSLGEKGFALILGTGEIQLYFKCSLVPIGTEQCRSIIFYRAH